MRSARSGASSGCTRSDCDQIVQLLQFGSGRQALNLARARRFERHAGAQVPVPDPDVRAGDGKRETLLAHAQRLFGAPARVDIADRPGHAQRHAAGVAHAQAARAHPAVLAVGVAHPILELVQRRLARQVRFDRREPGRDVVGVHLHLRVPRLAWCLLGPGRQPVQLARSRRCEDRVAVALPVPDAVVGTGHGERETLARILQGLVRGVEPAQLARKNRQQQHRQQAERERAQRGADRLGAPFGERGLDVARDDDGQRVVGHGPHRGEALDAVDGTAQAQGSGIAGAARRERRIDRRVPLAERAFHRRVACEQGPVAVQQASPSFRG